MIRVYKNGLHEVWTDGVEFFAYVNDHQVGAYTSKSRAIEAMQRW